MNGGEALYSLRTVFDVLLVATLVYRGLLVIKGTRAAPMLTGLSFIVLLYFMAKPLGLVTLAWILENFLSSLILVVVVIFQDEIRRGLTKVGLHPLYRREEGRVVDRIVEDLVLVCARFSELRLGALIVIKREVGLDELVEDAAVLDAAFNRKLLLSIFVTESPLHDGAVIIEQNRIKAAGCLLPLSSNPDLDPNLGTRHRAALGLSERSDAVIVVVSEENGSVSFVREGKIIRNLDTARLRELLRGVLRVHDTSPAGEPSAEVRNE